MSRASVRDYAILYVGQGGRSGSGAGATVGGGASIVTTPVHKLDGAEHQAPDDTTRLDATTTRHGLLPKLPGDPNLSFLGDGSWGPSGLSAFVPTLIDTGETWTVPEDRQALFALTIDVVGLLEVDGFLVEVD